MREGQPSWRERLPFLAATTVVVLAAAGVGWGRHAGGGVRHHAERVALLPTPMPVSEESLLPFEADPAEAARVATPAPTPAAAPVRRHRTARD